MACGRHRCAGTRAATESDIRRPHDRPERCRSSSRPMALPGQQALAAISRRCLHLAADAFRNADSTASQASWYQSSQDLNPSGSDANRWRPIQPWSAASSGSTCACCLGSSPGSLIRRPIAGSTAMTFGSSGYLHQSQLDYVAGHAGLIIEHAAARRREEPISTATAEGTMQWLLHRRMNASQRCDGHLGEHI